MKEVVEGFTELTGYDLVGFMTDFADFFEKNSPSIIDFYKGILEELPSSNIDELERLIKEVNKIEEIFISNRDSFNTSNYCDLVDICGDIKVKLLTIQNTSKWVRSSITLNNYSSNIEVDVTLNQNETLERLAKKVGYLEENDDWIDLALRNDIIEEDYTSQGGLRLKVSLQNNSKINVLSVVDSVQGDSVYGIDIQKVLEFENDDLKTLSYKDTISQAFNIALNLRRGDNQEFPIDGLESSLIVGQNFNSILYPSIFRQYYQVFAKDDTFKNITILDIKQVTDKTLSKDMVQLKVQAQTRLDEVITENILI